MLAYITRTFLLVALLLSLPAGARAWTETQVTSTSAQLDLTQPRAAKVELSVGVHVSAGWLSRFELIDLDADLEPAAAIFQASDGTQLTPSLSRPKPGTVVLEFGDKKGAPHRGDYVLHFAYTTGLALAAARPADTAHAASHVTSWSLPRWPTQLHNVQVRVLAPRGTRVVHLPEREHFGDGFVSRDQGGAVELTFTRLELPRTERFTIAFELPRAAGAAESVLPGLALPERAAWLFAAGFVLLLLCKRRLTHRVCAREGLVAVPVLGFGPSWLRRPLGFVLSAFAIAYFDVLPLFAAVSGVLGSMLCLDRALVVVQRSARVTLHKGTLSELERTPNLFWPTRLEPSYWLDVSTPIGWAVALFLYALLAWTHAWAPAAAGCSALLLTPLLCTGCRAARPHCASHALEELAALQSRLDVPSSLHLHEDAQGRVIDARLRLEGPGELEIGFVQDENGRTGPRSAFLCRLPSGTAAALRAVQRGWIARKFAREDHRTLLRPTVNPARELPELLALLTKLEAEPKPAQAQRNAA